MREVYLDNSATTRPLPEVVEAMVKTLQDNYGNPSSLHNKGLEAEKILKEARQKIARRLAASPEEIHSYFRRYGKQQPGHQGNRLPVSEPGQASDYH